jgi:hypothetical protein
MNTAGQFRYSLRSRPKHNGPLAVAGFPLGNYRSCLRIPCHHNPSSARSIAGEAGFLTLTQLVDRPER